MIIKIIKYYERTGDLEGVLTRGKKWDRIFPPFWDCPIDMQRREDMRRKKTELIIIALNLEKNVIEQQEKNKLEQEEKARIKIDVNGNRIISVKTEEIKCPSILHDFNLLVSTCKHHFKLPHRSV